MDKKEIESVLRKNLPESWANAIDCDMVNEVHFRIDGLEKPYKHIMACIRYMLDYGDGDPIGLDYLINETDDCNIWDYVD